MKTKLLKKFRAKYQVKWVHSYTKEVVENSDGLIEVVEVLERTGYFVVDKKTGYVFPRTRKSIRECLISRIDEFVGYFEYRRIVSGVPLRKIKTEQKKLKRLIELGRY